MKPILTIFDEDAEDFEAVFDDDDDEALQQAIELTGMDG